MKFKFGPVIIIGLALVIGFWYLKRHTDVFGGVSLTDVTSIAAQDKKKKEAVKIQSLGGGARPQDYEKVKFY